MNDTAKPADELVVPPPTTTNRRPRVREVSSRFLSSSTNNSVGEDKATVRVTNNNNKQFGGGVSTPVIRRSLSADSSPLGSFNYCGGGTRAGPPPATQKRAVVKLFKENNGGASATTEQQIVCDDEGGAVQLLKKAGTCASSSGKLLSSTRPDTPIISSNVGGAKSRPDTPMTSASNRIVASRFRQMSSSQIFHHTQTSKVNVQASAAARLLQSSGLAKSSVVESPCLGSDEAKEGDGLGCGSKSFPNSPTSQNSCRARCLNLDTRSSMPDSRLLLVETSSSNSIGSDSQLNVKYSSCSRSLNFPFSNSGKMMGESLSLPPPHPAYTKQPAGADVARKGRKIFNHQEQVHSLRLLQNNYLQWRFANAKAEASLRAQTSDTERKLHSLGVQISDLRDAVKRKRTEIGLLQRIKTLSTIVETHMPYLDEWSTFEEEYSTSLSETSQALSNSLVRLPVGGNVQVDIKEVGESLNSAMRVMEMIGVHVQSFMPKANEMDTLISELAKLVGGERVLIDECGGLLFKAYISQVEDCSLRGHLMQLQNMKHLEVQE